MGRVLAEDAPVSRSLSPGAKRLNWSANGVWLAYTTDRAIDRLNETWRTGYILTPHGVVALYSQTGNHPSTSLTFIAGGRHFRIDWDRNFTDRWLKTLARIFAAECVR